MREEVQRESEKVGKGEEVTMVFKRMIPIFLAAVCAFVVICASASAEIVHPFEGSFNGSDAPSGPFSTVAGIAVDRSGGPSEGNVYVGDAALKKAFTVEKFHADGSYAGVSISGAETSQGSFPVLSSVLPALIFGVALDGTSGANHGDVYVADAEHGVVDRFNEKGEFECQIAGAETEAAPLPLPAKECDELTGSGLGGAFMPSGVTVSTSGDVYVSDFANHVIDEFEPTGRYMRTIESPEITEPTGLAIDSSGNLYVVNLASDVVEFNATGELVKVLAANSPFSVALDPSTGHIDVGSGEEFADHVAEFEVTGEQHQLDSFGTAQFKDNAPIALAIDSAGRVYASAFIFNAPTGAVDMFGPFAVVPNVSTGHATITTKTSAEVHGHVDPDTEHGGGEITACEFEYVTEKQFKEHSGNHYEDAFVTACEPPVPYGGATDVSAQLSNLTPETVYHFRLQAANADLAAGNRGEDETFT